jgi:signal transduction histidine kinase
LIFGTMLVITVAHYLTSPSLFLWHEILERLYYLPIVFAAVYFGWLGGLVSAVCAGLCYAPHIIMAWSDSPRASAPKYAEIVVFVAVGVVTGILSDRERRRTRELQSTTDRLREVYGQLQSSFDQLKRADRLSAVGQLAASLAHEIRNPLAGIEGAIDIVERASSEERRREFLAIIKKETGRLKNLLTNLLDFARPRPPQMRNVRIDGTVVSVAQLTAPNAQQRGIELKTDIPASLPLVECDVEQIKQVLVNITLNAIEASSTGGKVVLTIRERGDNIVIGVTDNGCGIDEADLEKIFDPFYTTKEGGTGLGLPISYQILAQHSGQITVERNADKGMTFNLILPRRQSGAR